MADLDLAWEPDWVVAPGEILVEALSERGMSQAELARRMGRPLKTISEIANGKAAVTPDTAIQLERALGISASLWNGLETRYREALARKRAEDEASGYAAWAAAFPVRGLRRARLLPDKASPEAEASHLLAFFGVSNPVGWERHWGQIAARYRMARTAKVSMPALSAWLRWGEIEAGEVSVSSFDAGHFRRTLDEVRGLTRRHMFGAALSQARELFASAGVILVVIPSLEGAPASGATRWLRGRTPLVQLTLRHGTDDQFWYSVFHEAGHVLTGRRDEIIEELDGPHLEDPDEQAADRFARDVLIPPNAYSAFISEKAFDRDTVRRFADSIGVSPGIVVGRLQHDRAIDWAQLNDLKRHYQPEGR